MNYFNLTNEENINIFNIIQSRIESISPIEDIYLRKSIKRKKSPLIFYSKDLES